MRGGVHRRGGVPTARLLHLAVVRLVDRLRPGGHYRVGQEYRVIIINFSKGYLVIFLLIAIFNNHDQFCNNSISYSWHALVTKTLTKRSEHYLATVSNRQIRLKFIKKYL